MNSTHLSLTKTDRNCTLFSCDFDPLFHFRSLPQKSILHFCGTRGKMNTGKRHFDLTRGNAVAGIREVSKGGRGGRLWHTILLARSSVLYLLLRPNKAIRSCGRACAVTSTDDLVPPFPNESRLAGLSFGEGVGSECGMQWSMSFRRNKRYIKAPVSRPSSRRSAVSQKDAFKMLARFGLVCSVCFQNESIFSRFTNPPIE